MVGGLALGPGCWAQHLHCGSSGFRILLLRISSVQAHCLGWPQRCFLEHCTLVAKNLTKTFVSYHSTAQQDITQHLEMLHSTDFIPLSASDSRQDGLNPHLSLRFCHFHFCCPSLLPSYHICPSLRPLASQFSVQQKHIFCSFVGVF